MKNVKSYADDWDEYVRYFSEYAKNEPTNVGRTDLKYPGDEWGTPEEWTAYADTFLRPFLPDDRSGIAVEIGPGSGKYTLEVVEKVKRMICFEVSKEFMRVAKDRLSQYIAQGKVEFELLKLWNCNEILKGLKSKSLLGEVHLFFSVDSMIHVELHTLIAYFINAAMSLRVGGHMAMGVASCTNGKGFRRLLDETPWCYGGMRPSHQFYFLSKDIVHFVTQQLGFEIVLFDEKRDINFVAKKVKEVSIEAFELDWEAKLKVIEHQTGTLADRITELEADRAARLEEIYKLSEKLHACEADREARLKVIERQAKEFGEKIREIEADRAARLEAIHDLSRKLQACEADLVARLEIIDRQQHELVQVHNILEAMKASRSWRLTAPLRWLHIQWHNFSRKFFKVD
ncbi:MAG: hypothetical protein FJ041_00325 [Candidatus Cloacimonetes bacterium]|nr:hypothetical protein [Candidatus Cloacimonadota bacterium]